MYFDLDTLEEIDQPSKCTIGIYGMDESHRLADSFDILNLADIIHNDSVRYEDHLSFETICVSFETKQTRSEQAIFIFISATQIHFVGDEKYLLSLLDKYKASIGLRKKGIGIILHVFLSHLNDEHREEMDQVLDELSMLEDEILDSLKDDNTISKRILKHRKFLLYRKRKYEQLMNVFDSLLENNNDIYTDRERSRLDILKGREGRVLSEINSMLEYVTEIREAYQSEVDNKQNQIMSLFTVITAIFLPLTLIAGWYGMNLKMPEFAQPSAYLIVILVCVGIVVFCIYYFKKKKWF